MHQCRGLECLPRSFVSHFVRRQSSQFVIDKRKQLIGGAGVTMFDGLEDLGDVTHTSRVTEQRHMTTPETVQSPSPKRRHITPLYATT